MTAVLLTFLLSAWLNVSKMNSRTDSFLPLCLRLFGIVSSFSVSGARCPSKGFLQPLYRSAQPLRRIIIYAIPIPCILRGFGCGCSFWQSGWNYGRFGNKNRKPCCSSFLSVLLLGLIRVVEVIICTIPKEEWLEWGTLASKGPER